MKNLVVIAAALAGTLASLTAGTLPLAPSAISTRAASHALVLPVAGNLAGGNGTHFRTDVTLVNHEATPRRVDIFWIERDRDNRAAVPHSITLPARTVVFFEDFVGSELRREGLGALRFHAVNASGVLDPEGRIDAFARIWTQQPGTSGTVSQSFYSQREEELQANASRPAYILGLQHDDRFRTNIGIVNLDPTASQTYSVHVVGTAGSRTFTVGPGALSTTQVPLPEGNYGKLYVVIVPSTGFLDPTGESTYAAYGSTVDNVTGDSWSVAATFGFEGE
jgi:hypothetical protein